VGTIFRYIFLLYLNRINVYPLSCSYVTDRNRLWTLTHTVDIHTHFTLTQTGHSFIHSDCGQLYCICSLRQGIHSLRLWTHSMETPRLQTFTKAADTCNRDTQTADTCSGDTHSDCGHLQWRHLDCRHSLRLWTLAMETHRLQTLIQTVDIHSDCHFTKIRS
jgi:hypothetical protein